MGLIIWMGICLLITLCIERKESKERRKNDGEKKWKRILGRDKDIMELCVLEKKILEREGKLWVKRKGRSRSNLSNI